jgi:HPt (histidine-containing phosphotransfer) domain-containing protein
MGEKIVVRIDPEIRELIPAFMENRRRELQDVRADLAGRRFDAVRKVGHTLAGVGSSYGFDDITRIGRELERVASGIAPAGGTDADVQLLHRLADELDSYLRRVEPIYS